MLAVYVPVAGALNDRAFAAFHFAGGLAGAHFVLRAYAALPVLMGRPHPAFARLVAVCAVCAAAVAWELGELAVDLYAGTRMQVDAYLVLEDLAMGLAGALTYALASALRPAR